MRFSYVIAVLCFCVEFGEGADGVHLHDGWFFGDVSARERTDLCVRRVAEPGVKGWGAFQEITVFLEGVHGLEEVGELRGEVLFQGGHPVEGVDLLGFRRCELLAVVEDLGDLCEQGVVLGI